MRIRCHGNLFNEQLPSDNPGIVDAFTGLYQATHILSRDRCIATAIHSALFTKYWLALGRPLFHYQPKTDSFLNNINQCV
jgi:hypothetical protein